MINLERKFILGTVYASVLSGIFYGVLKFFFKVDGPFGQMANPWQSDLHHIHIIVSPFVLFSVGLLWKNHIWLRISTDFRKLRKTGISLTVLFFIMVLTGYFYQSSTSENSLFIWQWTHIISSCLWTILFVFHHVYGQSKKL
jgi:hypothetical protein